MLEMTTNILAETSAFARFEERKAAMEGIGLGILIGIGITSMTRTVRPIAKGALKFGLVAAAAVRNAFYEGRETFADLLAEVKHELAQEQREVGSGGGLDASGRGEPAPPV
jgi:hypothetical protein